MALFSHLLGLSRADSFATSKAEGEDKREDKDEDNKESKAEAGDDDKDSKAKAEEEKDESEDEDEKTSKASDDDKADDDEKSKAFAAGVQAERGRTSTILKAASSLQHLAVAAELVCTTRLSASEAKAVMSISGAFAAEPPKRGLSERMSTQPAAGIGPDPAGASGGKASEASQQASRILAAARAAGGKF